jgi:hypothetical protein
MVTKNVVDVFHNIQLNAFILWGCWYCSDAVDKQLDNKLKQSKIHRWVLLLSHIHGN